MVVHRVDPDYSKCRVSRVTGIQLLEATIDVDGKPLEVRMLKESSPCESEALLTAVRKWSFRPGTLAGKPVPAIFSMSVNVHYR